MVCGRLFFFFLLHVPSDVHIKNVCHPYKIEYVIRGKPYFYWYEITCSEFC